MSSSKDAISRAVTWGGLKVHRDINPNATGQVAKAAAGQIYGWFIYNAAASVRYVKIYDKATAPTGADTPLLTLPIPATSGANVHLAHGVECANGISVRCTTGAADNDAVGSGANEVQLNLFYF